MCICVSTCCRDFFPGPDALPLRSWWICLPSAWPGVLAWYSWEFVAESREFGDQIFSDLPVWPFQAVLPVGFALIAYRYLISAAVQLRKLVRGGVRS